MSSKSVQIIGGPAREHAYVDAATNALLVKVVNPSSGGGGGGAIDLAEYGGSPVGAANAVHVQPGTGAVFVVSDGGGSLTVDGAVSVSNFPTVYPVNDNGGSLTVDGAVAATQSGTWTVTVVDGGGSLTVDGAVSVSNFPSVYPVNDNGGSLTVDGTVAVSNFPSTYDMTGSTVEVFNLTHALMLGQMKIEDASGSGSGPFVRIAPDGATYVHETDAGMMLALPMNTAPKPDELTSTPGPMRALRADQGGNLLMSGFVRGRVGTASRVLDVVVEGEQYGPSTPYGAAINGAVVGAVCVEDIAGVTRADRDFGSLRLDLNQRLHTTVGGLLPGSDALSMGKAWDAPGTSGDVGISALALRNEGGSTLVSADLDYSPIAVNRFGYVYVSVQGSVAVSSVTSITPGTAATSLGKAEDAASASGDVGVAAMAIRRDTLASTTSANGDYTNFAVDSVGALWVRQAGMTTLALSGSTRGRPIQITGTNSGAAVTVHTATTTTGQLDRLYIYLSNTSDSAVVVTIEYGTTGTANELEFTVPAGATIPVLEGVVLGGAATDTVKAYAGTANVVNVIGRVERLS